MRARSLFWEFRRRLLLTTLLVVALMLLAIGVVTQIVYRSSLREQKQRLEDFVSQSSQSLAGQVLIYQIHKLPLDPNLRLMVKTIDEEAQLEIRAADGSCAFGGSCALFSSQPSRLLVYRAPLHLGDEKLGEVAVAVPRPHRVLALAAWPVLIIVLGFILIWILLRQLLSRFLDEAINRPIGQLNQAFRRLAAEPDSSGVALTLTEAEERRLSQEFLEIFGSFNEMSGRLRESVAQEKAHAVDSAISKMAVQVAHDIRSPLAALDVMLGQLKSLPEDQRIIVRTAVTRIRDIANNLVAVNRADRPELIENNAGNEVETVALLFTLLDPLVTEKRLQYRGRPGLEIDTRLDKSAYSAFARLQINEFKRLLSNLIDNAVEALGTQPGRVVVSLGVEKDEVVVRVCDNGPGIAPERLPQLMKRGATFGKSGGSGLGLFHAKQSMERWHGKLHLQSTLGRGTEASLCWPKASPPSWFVPEIVLRPGARVWVVDDDLSIHQIWRGRFQAAGLGLETHYVFTLEDLRDELRGCESLDHDLFLIDYEFSGSVMSGLDEITSRGIEAQSFLVTSRFEELAILDRAERAGVRVIPKAFASVVPIRVLANLEKLTESPPPA